MREGLKGALGVVFIFALMGAVMGYAANFKDPLWHWLAPGSGAIVALACGIGMAKIEFRKDLVPDFLYQEVKRYFDCNGFCFAIAAGVENGEAVINILFQNRHDRRVEGRVALRPAQGFLARAKIPIFGVDISCPPAGFGVARVPWPVPAKYQGTRQKFDVGADVRHPDGLGKCLRFRISLVLRGNANFKNPFGTAMTVAGLATGAIIISTPASVTVTLPSNVAEVLPDVTAPAIITLWKLGDPVTNIIHPNSPSTS